MSIQQDTSAATIEDAYAAATSYKDMCAINVQFLSGVYDHTAYHRGPVADETHPLLDDLRFLNKLGMYTFNGQPGMSMLTLNGPVHTDLDTDSKPKIWHAFQQRAYIEGFVQNKYIQRLTTYLDSLHNDGIYYQIEYPDCVFNSNIPFTTNNPKSTAQSYVLNHSAYIAASGFTIVPEMHTHILSHIEKWQSGGTSISTYGVGLEDQIDFHIAEGMNPSIFQDCVAVTLTTRDFNSHMSLEKIMIQFFLEHARD